MVTAYLHICNIRKDCTLSKDNELSMGLCSSDKFTGESVVTHPDRQVLVLSRYGSCQQVVTHAQFKGHICTQTAHAWALVSVACSFNWEGKCVFLQHTRIKIDQTHS